MKKFLFFIILLAIPITFFLWAHFGIVLSAEIMRFFKKSDQISFNPNKCYRASCDVNYKEYDWSKKHFFEIIQLKSQKIFSGHTLFKDGKFSGETINIIGKDNIRLTKQSEKIKNDKKIYVFGGSVAWGFGSKDDLTLPSLIANEFDLQTFNYAQQGWTSTQNLIELIRLISQGKKMEYVIFFDGVNDAIELCNKKNDHLKIDSMVTDSIQSKLKEGTFKPTSFESYFSTFSSLGAVLKYKFIKDYHLKRKSKELETQMYDCHIDKNKTKVVTNYSLNNWKTAKILTENQGGKFYLILQPNPFFDNTKMAHINDIFNLALQDETYKASVTLFFDTISQKLSDKDYFLDLKSIFNDKYEYIYSDWAGHIAPKGYAVIVLEFKEKFNSDF